MMDWNLFLQVVLPLGAFSAWIYNRLDKKFDAIDKRFDDVNRKFEAIIAELKEMRRDMQSMDSRLSRLEGRFEEGHYWEPEVKEK